jgi:hypothetical protein
VRSLVIALFLPALLSAQSATRSLAAPNERLNVEFSELASVRELVDGRVLLFDRKEERLVVADFTTGAVRDIARRGQGPAEFEAVFALVPLAGDTTIAADMTRRWLILVGDSVVRKIVPEHVPPRGASAPLGADLKGRVLLRVFGASTDSTSIVLVDRTSGNAETIAHLAMHGKRTPSPGMAPGRGSVFRISKVPLEISEESLLFSDGWVAVVRIEPYRVDWRAPDGRWSLGAPLPFRAIRTTAAEKAAYIVRKPGFRNSTEWPDELPPFEAPVTLLGSPDGLLLVKLLQTRAEPALRYDVVDRSGTARRQIVLARNQHILGFGASSIYVVETDNDGIQRLQRHPWSTAPRP